MVSAALADAGGKSFLFEDDDHGGVWVRTSVLEGADAPGQRAKFEAGLQRLGTSTPELAPLQPQFALLEPEDVAASWRKSLKPFRIGKLAVLPPWSEAPLRADDRVLRLEPGMAFGSGRHVTTRACLHHLQQRLAPGDRVLDAGTGSGILAVAASLFDAERALAFDLDPHACQTARSLAQSNAVAQQCEFRTGGFEVLQENEHDFDLIFANLYADVLVHHARELAVRLAASGALIASGIAKARLEEVLNAFEAQGLHAPLPLLRRGWWTLCLQRR